MNIELKKQILNFIIDNRKIFQLHNLTTNNFREYIYNSKGDYLIGGENVSNFINSAIKLLTNDK